MQREHQFSNTFSLRFTLRWGEYNESYWVFFGIPQIFHKFLVYNIYKSMFRLWKFSLLVLCLCSMGVANQEPSSGQCSKPYQGVSGSGSGGGSNGGFKGWKVNTEAGKKILSQHGEIPLMKLKPDAEVAKAVKKLGILQRFWFNRGLGKLTKRKIRNRDLMESSKL